VPNVWAQVRVAHDHADVVDGNVEVLGEHLGQRGDRTLAHLDLAREARHVAVLVNVQEGVEVPCRLGAHRDRMRRLRHLGARGPAEDDPYEEARAQALDKLTARREQRLVLHGCTRPER